MPCYGFLSCAHFLPMSSTGLWDINFTFLLKCHCFTLFSSAISKPVGSKVPKFSRINSWTADLVEEDGGRCACFHALLFKSKVSEDYRTL